MLGKRRQTTDAFLRHLQASIPVPVQWANGCHVASRLLTPDENQKVFDIIGGKRKVLACTAAQVWFAIPKDAPVWMKQHCGVLCFVKDSRLKSFFIRLVDISSNAKECVLWEQEIYKQFKYNVALESFHTFEGDNCNVGLNFCDLEEAQHFQKCIKQRVSLFKKMKKKGKQRHSEVQQPGVAEPTTSTISHIISDEIQLQEINEASLGIKTGLTHSGTSSNKSNLKSNISGALESKAAMQQKFIKQESNQCCKTMESNLPLILFSRDEDSATKVLASPETSEIHQRKVRNARFPSNDKSRPITRRETPGREFPRTQLSIHSVKGKLSPKRSLIPLLKNSSHSLPRKRSSDTVKNVKYQRYTTTSNQAAKRIHEKQKDYHSNIIKSLFVASRLKNTKNNSGKTGENEVVLAADSSSGSKSIDDSVASNEESRSDCQPVRESETDHTPSAQFRHELMKIRQQSGLLSVESNRLLTGKSLSFKSNSSLNTLAPWHGGRSLRCSDNNFGCGGDGSHFSFPSLPSIAKLQLSSSMQLKEKELFENNTTTKKQFSGSISGIGSTNGCNEVADEKQHPDWSREASKECIKKTLEGKPKFCSTFAKVLDLRAELMKSIIAGTALRKVGSGVLAAQRNAPCKTTVFENVLAKALEERNKAMRHSSDEDEEQTDDDDDDEWFDASEAEFTDEEPETGTDHEIQENQQN